MMRLMSTKPDFPEHPVAARTEAPARPDRPTGLAGAGLLLAAYIVLEWISYIHELNDFPVTPWNPGLGAVFAAMVLKGPIYGLVLFAGVILAELSVLQSDLPLAAVIAIATIVAAGYATAAFVIRRMLNLDVGLHHLRDISVLVGGGLAGAAAVAVSLTALLLAIGRFQPRDIVGAAVPLLVGDVIGIAVVTPFVLRVAARWHDVKLNAIAPLLPEIAVYAGVIALTLWIILEPGGEDRYKSFYLLFLPVVAAALRHGLDGACLALAGTQLGLVGLLHSYRYDTAAFTEFQMLMLALTATALLVGVIVSEREQADRAARQAEARLKEKETEAAQVGRVNLVSGMASALAHEINQPLTAARALARSVDLLLRSPHPDMQRAAANLGDLVAQIDHAGGIVSRMRDFMRRGQPDFGTLDLGETIEAALALVRAEAHDRGIRIDLDLASPSIRLHGDRVQLQQVVLNLVRNAMDAIAAASIDNGRVDLVVRTRPETREVEVSVRDNGIGIDPDMAPRIFEPLLTSKTEGLGLGLSISASIIQAHGGRLWLQSSDPGATDFRFTLPLGPHTQLR